MDYRQRKSYIATIKRKEKICAAAPHGDFMYEKFWKRFFDIILSLTALILLSPTLIVLTIIGTIEMGGNPFFVQPRPGKIDKKTGKEKIFKLVKFRTMHNHKDADGNLLSDTDRLNKYGKFLRKTSLDELPELFTIFLGNMSIVGPRPQLVRDMVFMTDEQRKRHTVTPGLTGLAQVNGRNNITWEKKFELDLEYINNITFLGDLKILLVTFVKVVDGSDTEREGTESDTDFGDWLLINNSIDRKTYEDKQITAEELLTDFYG